MKLLPRKLEYKKKSEDEKDTFHATWVTTYGQGYDEVVKKSDEINKTLSLSPTWRKAKSRNVVKVVPRRAPNLKDVLFKRKAIALGTGIGKSLPCTDPTVKKRGAKCQCCQLVSKSASIESNGTVVETAGGNCKSSNIIYAATCKLCTENNVYIGKTVMSLHERVNSHRSGFYAVIDAKPDHNDKSFEVDDANILGYHIYKTHNKLDRKDFNLCYKFDIVSNAAPSNIRLLEQHYIDKLNTLAPYGLNQINSIF